MIPIVLIISTVVQKMFGITDPWIIGAYVGCFVSVIVCCIVGIRAKNLGDDDAEDEE